MSLFNTDSRQILKGSNNPMLNSSNSTNLSVLSNDIVFSIVKYILSDIYRSLIIELISVLICFYFSNDMRDFGIIPFNTHYKIVKC